MAVTANTTARISADLQLPLFGPVATASSPATRNIGLELEHFRQFGKTTRVFEIPVNHPAEAPFGVPAYVNEFWTARQRQANSLHEVSYRACFKPQLPRFFIERLTSPGEIVYDPFMGRGTTLLEAALLGRVPFGNDANPLSTGMTRPRLSPPFLADVEQRLQQIDLNRAMETPKELLVFYHPETLQAICSLREYLIERRKAQTLDPLDEWILLVALNRLTGHSSGFFSVYSLPPNQAVSVRSQQKINRKRNQTPPLRDVPRIILKKSKQLLGDIDSAARETLAAVAPRALLLTGMADQTPTIPPDLVSLVVTSPPFLNVVQYATDNWLRCWFLGIDAKSVQLTTPTRLEAWQKEMTKVFRELYRVVRAGGHVAFEVGEVHGGTTKLEETVLPCGMEAGLRPVLVLINDQKFTKTANCWGIENMAKGTNTNRIVLFTKP